MKSSRKHHLEGGFFYVLVVCHILGIDCVNVSLYIMYVIYVYNVWYVNDAPWGILSQILTMEDPSRESQDGRQGKMLLHTEYSLLSLLHQQNGVVHHHGLFQVTLLSKAGKFNIMHRPFLGNKYRYKANKNI